MAAKIRTLRFFLSGCLIGTLGVLAYGSTLSARDWFTTTEINSDTGVLASASCIPNTPEEEVFYISCGGIY